VAVVRNWETPRTQFRQLLDFVKSRFLACGSGTLPKAFGGLAEEEDKVGFGIDRQLLLITKSISM
jgi:hypothetical protein